MKTFTQMMTLLLAVTVAMTPGLLQAGGMSGDAGEKLAQAEALAREVRADAATMQTYVRFPTTFSEDAHSRTLRTIKENTNDLGDIVQSLHRNRSEIEEWQAELVNRLIPRMDVLTTDIENAIRFINDNPPEATFKPVYEDYVDGAYNQADSIVTTIDRYFEWIEGVRAKEELEISQVNP